MREYPKFIRVWWPAFTGIRGFVLGRRLIVSRDPIETSASHWAHEWKHTLQMRELGTLGFYWKILGQYLRHGYRRAPLEVEAREFSRDSSLWAADWHKAKAEAGIRST